MKYCQQCGEVLNDDAAFCGKCGTRTSGQASAAMPAYDAGNQQTYSNDPGYYAPFAQLKTNRSLLKLILLSLVTFGIYAIVVYSSISTDINLIASRYDGKKTMHYCLLLFLVGPITFGIGTIVWMHKISGRIGDELQRRGINYSFGAGDFWLWNVLGSLIFVGPFIYVHKLCTSMNLLCENYNIYG